ncbi:MAG: LTA synthase family protein [Bacteroidetes bacterium]|nr:LTA synthase family protein [Bacteroidota bacterium]
MVVVLKTIYNYFVKPAIYFLLLFAFLKALFLFVNFNDIRYKDAKNLWLVFTNSFSIDFAVVCYISLLPLTVFLIQIFIKKNILHPFLIAYFTCVSFIAITINFIDIRLFSYWSSKLSAKALFYLNTPLMSLKSAGKWQVLILFIVAIILTYISYKVLKILIKKQEINTRKWYLYLPAFLLLSGLAILGLRGGFRVIPINQSDAYFSDDNTLNVAGVNSLWNFGNVLFQNNNSLKTNPYKVMDEAKAEEIFKNLYHQEKDTLINILNIKRPNIIYIALEGVNANCIKEYNSWGVLMPNVENFIKEGYTFKQMYASGLRTDQGLVSIISGFPAMPFHTIGAQPEKFQHLPSLSLALKEEGYTNTFFFAGEPEFGSFKAFLKYNGFGKVYGLQDYPKEQLTQELGAPDEFLFAKFIEDTKNAKEPFFNLVLTQTTHEPYDMPFNEGEHKDIKRYDNAVIYVDSILGVFYEQCKNMPWFDNTLFILSSDHAHKYPGDYWYNDKERFHIPFILFGNALKNEFKGKKTEQLVNQTDIPYSLSKQLSLKKQYFEFSKDIFSPYSPPFSTFTHIHGHDLILPDNFCFLNYEIPNNLYQETDSCLLKSGAYFQYVFDRYMGY